MRYPISRALMATLLLLAPAIASAYYAPLQAITTEIEYSGDEARLVCTVYDPVAQENRSCYSGGHPGLWDPWIENNDGIVACVWATGDPPFQESHILVMAYDPAVQAWQEWEGGPYGPLVHFGALENNDGVVFWVLYPDDPPPSSCEVHRLTYDPEVHAWSHSGEETSFHVASWIVQDGLTAYVVCDIDPLWDDLSCAMYDPILKYWAGHAESGLDIRLDTVIAGALHYTRDSSPGVLGYDAAQGMWIGSATSPLAYCAAGQVVGEDTLRQWVWFTDMSIGGTGWSYDFGDGVHSALRSASHFYQKCAPQEACQSCSSELGSDDYCVDPGAQCEAIYVPDDAPRIQDAVELAIPGDTVVLREGRYTDCTTPCGGGHDRCCVRVDKSLVLRGETGDPEDVAIDPQGAGLGISIEASGVSIRDLGVTGGYNPGAAGGIGSNFLLDDIRIANCYIRGNEGNVGGILLFDYTYPICKGIRVDSCVIEGNVGYQGGGIGAGCMYGGHVIIEDCQIRGNTAAYGGGLSAGGFSGGVLAEVVVRGCTLEENVATGKGGGIEVFGNVAIESTTLRGNGASEAGADIAVTWAEDGTTLSLERCIFAYGMGSGSFHVDSACGSIEITVECTDIFGDELGNWTSCISGLVGVAGNLEADPLFCDSLHPEDPLSLHSESPCAPGNSSGCGLIGARPVACSVSGVAAPPSVLAIALRAPRPNPFNPTTTISFSIPVAGPVSLMVHDVTGRLVATLIDGVRQPGEFAAAWNGKDASGADAPSGIYFARLHAGEYGDVRKMVLLR